MEQIICIVPNECWHWEKCVYGFWRGHCGQAVGCMTGWADNMACSQDRWFLVRDQAISFVDAGWGFASYRVVTGLIF